MTDDEEKVWEAWRARAASQPGSLAQPASQPSAETQAYREGFLAGRASAASGAEPVAWQYRAPGGEWVWCPNPGIRVAQDYEIRALYASPVARQPLTSEHHIALREAYGCKAEDDYFAPRPVEDSVMARRAFEQGFARGFDKGTEIAATPAPRQDQAVATSLEPKWLPIETAPKDGTHVLCVTEGYTKVSIRWFFNATWHWDGDYYGECLRQPTFWMPLPQAPDSQEKSRQPESSSAPKAGKE